MVVFVLEALRDENWRVSVNEFQLSLGTSFVSLIARLEKYRYVSSLSFIKGTMRRNLGYQTEEVVLATHRGRVKSIGLVNWGAVVFGRRRFLSQNFRNVTQSHV